MFINKISNFLDTINVILNNIEEFENNVAIAVDSLIKTIQNGKIIAIAGNGGSYAEAEHFVGELIGRYYKNRAALPCILLPTSIASLTAIANDYDYNYIITKEIEGLKNNIGAIIFLSTSGNSKNLIQAAKFIEQENLDIIRIGLLGKDGGELKKYCEVPIIIPSNDTPTIQEFHLMLLHYFAEVIERELFKD